MNRPKQHAGRALILGACLGGALGGLLYLIPSPVVLAEQDRKQQKKDEQPKHFHHPKINSTIPCNSEGSFAAYGLLDEVPSDGITCVLKDKDGTKVCTGDPLLVPNQLDLHWSFAFWRVPQDKNNPPYVIELRSQGGALIDCLPKLKLKAPIREGTILTWPASGGGTVNTTFTAYGSTSSTVSGQMVKPCFTRCGFVTAGGSTWYMTFQNVPTGTGWTLNVWDTGHPEGGALGPAASASPLTVQ